MGKSRIVIVLAVLLSLVLAGCSAVADVGETVTARPLATAGQTVSPTRLPTGATTLTPQLSDFPSATPMPTVEPVREDLAPVGHYEVLTLSGETTVHMWLEFMESCLQAGEPTVARNGMTIEVSVPLVRREDAACEQQYLPTELYVPLDTSDMEPGTYTVIVNGGQDTYESSYPTLELASITPTPPEGCPVPTEDAALFVDETGTYCVLYPAGWHPESSGYLSPYLSGGDEAVRIRLNFRAIGSAEGRTLDQMVGQNFGEELRDPNLMAEQSRITLGGEPAALIMNVSGITLSHHWYVIHDGTVYEGSVGGFGMELTTPYAQQAFGLFMSTLTWLR